MKPILSTSALKTFVAACAVSATAFTPLAASSASADGWRRDGNFNCGPRGCYNYHPPRHHRDNDGSAAAAAILGLAGVAIIAGALSQPAPPPVRYVQPRTYPPTPYAPRVITYESTLEPWSPAWYKWCDERYRTFNPRTGTYHGYDGLDHFCVPR